MSISIIQTLIWISAGAILFIFMRRRRSRKAQR